MKKKDKDLNLVADAMLDKHGGNETAEDGQFIFSGSFELRVPEDYDHDNQLESFIDKNRKRLSYVNEHLVDYNFANVTQKLKPGETYIVERYIVTSKENGNTGEDCLNFYKKKKALLVGAQGLLAAFQDNEEEFDKSMHTVSFDEEKALCEEYVYAMPSLFYVRSKGKWSINLVQFESTNFAAFYCLLLFREKDTDQKSEKRSGSGLRNIESEKNKNNADDRFKLLDQLELTAPQTIKDNFLFEEFYREKHKRFFDYNNENSDASFATISNKLTAGKTYTVKLFEISRGKFVSSEECLEFLKTQKAILIGLEGVWLVWNHIHKLQHLQEAFPAGKYAVSFDEKELLWKNDQGRSQVPNIGRDFENKWSFFLDTFDAKWDANYILLCFNEKETE
ncbi:MAG: hypothetical protein WC788_09490 [Candidatus Paceibacterota bacterium]|jgi:hypothetical protein